MAVITVFVISTSFLNMQCYKDILDRAVTIGEIGELKKGRRQKSNINYVS